MRHYSIIVGCLIFLCLSATPILSEEPKESFYPQAKRTVVRLEHFETLIQEGSPNPIIRNVPDGTAFFVAGYKQLFIVSARHVVEKPYDLHARIQTKNNSTGENRIFLLKLPRDKWVYHSYKGDDLTHYVDVAAMRIIFLRDWGIVSFLYENKESPEHNKNQLPYEDPEPPSPILVFGFPADVGFALEEQNPIGRLGIVSMKAGKKFVKIDSNKYAEERSCLIDARIFAGNSGSPVMNQMRLEDPQPKLLGLVTAANNMLDFAIIEPTSRIRETIDLAKDKEPQGFWEEIMP